ncbi:hypothetical protein [Lignipirellula cremea]|uniref:hypothetical protein n=1 Tax=Lignipirellula cremea TaxID=2528010 RepID=UPI0011A0F47D|nr:hypothetical protein [Lignipirellula cremea]
MNFISVSQVAGVEGKDVYSAGSGKGDSQSSFARSAKVITVDFGLVVLQTSRRRKYASFHGVKGDCPAFVLPQNGERESIS